MAKEMLGCPHCNSAYLGDSNQQHNCPVCSMDLIRLNMSEVAWDALSSEAKENHKQRMFSNLDRTVMSNQSTSITLRQMADDVRMIRNIMLGSVILSFVLFLFTIFSLMR